ncbi:MAG: hypothetical protein HW416_2084 [Chloroflexi bacterium]|nr:hypothetical protein [Chloroflexota bacterium]
MMTARAALAILLLASMGCNPATPSTAPNSQPSDAVPRPIKTLTIAQLNSVKAYALWDFNNTDGGGTSLAEIHTNGLVTADADGNLAPQLAAKLPSLEDGTIVLLPDGRMQTTWQLRPNIRWHDGTPFTADDVVLTWQIAVDPDLRQPGGEIAQNIERVEATGPLTMVMSWRTTFYRALDLGVQLFWPYPRHLLAEPFQGDKNAFRALPYFSTDYVQLGPFRLLDFGLGEQQVFERFDAYYLGRPKLDRIVIRTIEDSNVVLASLRSGALDVATEKVLPSEGVMLLREEWSRGGGGRIVQRQENWRYLWFQFHPEYARPIEISQDVGIRRGLLYALDRNALRELLYPGFANTSADSFMPTNDPRASAVGQPFSRYAFDPSRATQELEAAGWRKSVDGAARNQAGDVVQIELRGVPRDTQEVAVVSENWRRLGLDIKENIPSLALQRDVEYKSKFPAIETRARSTGDQIFNSFDTRRHSTPQNRWTGDNSGHYTNPVLDRMIDGLHGTLDKGAQGAILREMGELIAADLPALPTYFRTNFAVVTEGVRALEDYAGSRGPGAGPGLLSRSSYLWDRD